MLIRLSCRQYQIHIAGWGAVRYNDIGNVGLFVGVWLWGDSESAWGLTE